MARLKQFTEPYPEFPVGDPLRGVSIFVKEVERCKSGLRVTIEVYGPSGAPIYSEGILINSQRQRNQSATAITELDSSIERVDVLSALMKAAVAMREEMAETDAPPSEPEAPTPEQCEAMWQKCRALAEAPNLLDQMLVAYRHLGLIGEEKNAKLLTLAAITRLLEKPVSALVTGPSSAGKSFLLQIILKMLPADAYVDYTSVSAKYLAYSDDNLKNRIVVLYEADGLSEGTGAYIMRSLLSENRLNIGTVEKTSGGEIAARKVDKEGPTALFSSTTMIRTPDAELLTRVLELPVNDSPEHSKAIMKGTAQRFSGEAGDDVDVSEFHALQSWLAAAGTRAVVIPYASSLADQVPAEAIRVRRDFSKLLSLITACAILHQAQRDQTPNGAIIASLKDYAIVRELMADAFASAQQESVTPAQREAVKTVAVLQAKADGQGISLTTVAKALKRDVSSTKRRLANPLKLGYLVNENEGLRGKRALYKIGEPLPDQIDALPAPELLVEEGTL